MIEIKPKKINWWKESVVYQIYPRSFKDSNGDGIGDLKGIISKLDYLKELGIDVIWLSPIYKSPNDDNGYDISDYQEIMDEFGTMEDFDTLVKEVHSRGLKLMLDIVVNHTSDEHNWFKESCKSEINKYRDYYIWKEGKGDQPPNNWESFFGGSAWKYSESTGLYYLHLFSKKQPDLNWENTAVRYEVYKMMSWWLEKGVDGFRLDVINFISKLPGFPEGEKIQGTIYTEKEPFIVCGPRIHEYLKEMNREVLTEKNIMTVGETPSISVEQAKMITNPLEKELNMIFQFDHMDVENIGNSKWTDNKFNLVELKSILSKWQYGLNDTGWNSLYWNNHDQPRVVSRFGNDDKYWKESAKMLATCLHLLKGTPYIYQGEEIGMTNIYLETIEEYKDLETINAYKKCTKELGYSNKKIMSCIHSRSRDNARTPMQWNNSKYGGFTTGIPWFNPNPNYIRINAESQINNSSSIFNYYKELIIIRKKYPIVIDGDFNLLLQDSSELFVYTRSNENKTLLVVCNFSENEVKYNIPKEDRFKIEPELLISNYSNSGYQSQIDLKPFESRAYLF